jgi:S1-C subfamily serine protease
VITAVDSDPVKDLDDMLTLLERRAPGETVMLSVWRNGSTRKQAVTLAAGE